MSIVFYVSGHGFGHATRQSALMAELLRRRPGLELHARTSAPAWLFPAAVRHWPQEVDVGLVQPNALDVDLPESLRRHEAFLAAWTAAVEREADFLRARGARLAVCDVPALGVAAAAGAGVRAVVIGNFTWDWILDAYAGAEPRWRGVVDRYASVYDEAPEAFRLPLHGEVRARRVIDAPLLARRSALSRSEARRRLGLAADAPPLVLVAFGGIGFEAALRGRIDDLSGFVFAGWGAPPRGLDARWIELAPRATGAHVDAVAASAAILTKPGYGMFSEAVAHRARLLYVPREDFREAPVLAAGLRELGFGRPLAREDFLAGRWRRALEELLSARVSWPDVDVDGAGFIAGRLLE